MERSKYDFLSYLRMLQDYEFRKHAGEEMEIMKRAQRKAFETHGSYYKYANNELDLPILNEESITRVSDESDDNGD